MKNLDSSWKYTTKVNIHDGERLVRESIYRQGASDFQEKLIEILENREAEDEPSILELVKNLKP